MFIISLKIFKFLCAHPDLHPEDDNKQVPYALFSYTHFHMLSPVFQHDTRYVYIEDKYQSGLSQVCSTTDSGEIFERKKRTKTLFTDYIGRPIFGLFKNVDFDDE